MTYPWLVWLGTLATSGGFGVCMALFWRVEPLPRPTEGRRGMARTRALLTTFRFMEPLIRRLAARLSPLLRAEQASRIEELLDRSGRHLGLDAQEWLGLTALSCAFGLAGGGLLGSLNDQPMLGSTIGLVVGAMAPLLRLNNATLERHKIIGRELPGAIDLAALCMASGLDFTASLAQVLVHLGNDSGPLEREFAHIMRGLQLGQTRREVLTEFARLAPLESVREFVAAVVQAELRGTPLREVLQIQASTLRLRRSVAAEEAAARAGVLLVIPLLLLMGSLLLLLIGPFIVNGFGL